MAINPQTIAQIVKPMLPKHISGRIDDAVSMASKFLAGRNIRGADDVAQCLREIGVPPNLINKIKQYSGHPIAKAISGFAGINAESFNKNLDSVSAQIAQPTPGQAETTAADPLARLRKGMNALNKK